MAWIKASYSTEEMDNSSVTLSTLTFVATVGRYNIFKLDNGNINVVIFGNQKQLLQLVLNHENCIFALKFLKSSNNKHKYTLNTPLGSLEVRTIAAAGIVMYTQSKRTISTDDTGLITIQ